MGIYEKSRRKLKFGFVVIMIFMMVVVGLLSGCSSKLENDSAVSYSQSEPKAAAENSVTIKNDFDSDVSLTSEAKAVKAEFSESVEAPMEQESGGSGSTGSLEPIEGFKGFNRKLIYKANVTLEVKDYGKAQSAIRDLVALSDGYILQFSDTKTTQEKGGTFVIKVPTTGFMPFISKLAEKYPDLQQTVQGQDVTEEYVDLTSRLKAKQAVESRLLAFMEKADKAMDLLNFSNNLGTVQEEIEQIKGRMRYLDQNVAFSTIEIRVYQSLVDGMVKVKGEEGTVLDRSWETMKQSTEYIYLFLTGLIIFLSGALPILLFMMIFAVPVFYILRKAYLANKRQNVAPTVNYGQKIETEKDEG